VEAVRNPMVRKVLGDSLGSFDRAMEERMRLAVERGELRASADPASLAMLACSVMYALAVRSRAGEPRAKLETIARATVDLVCG
jgi:hypothetical protein